MSVRTYGKKIISQEVLKFSTKPFFYVLTKKVLTKVVPKMNVPIEIPIEILFALNI